jgi:hypothetical protein
MEAIRVIANEWPLGTLYADQAQALEAAVACGLQSAEPETRTVAAKCFWLLVAAFPARRDRMLNALDARTRRVVERGKSVEEEEAEYKAATKVQAAMKGFVARRQHRRSLVISSTVSLGARVELVADEFAGARGVVRFMGNVPGKEGLFVGVETDAPVPGGTSGEFAGSSTAAAVRLFSEATAPGCAVFVRMVGVRPEGAAADDAERALAAEIASANEKWKVTTTTTATTTMTTATTGGGIGNASGGDEDDAESDAAATAALAAATDRLTLASGIAPSGVARINIRPATSASGASATPGASSPSISAAVPTRVASPPRTLRPSIGSSDRNAPSALLPPPSTTTAGAPRGRHARQLSVPALNERAIVRQEHEFHLRVLEEALCTERDLLETEALNPEYVNDMILLLDEIARRTSFLQTRLADYRRRVGNQEFVQDEFLEEMDNFAD